MRFLDVILISILLCLFSSILAGSVIQMRKMDSVIEDYYLKTASVNFISQSFCNVCSGKGFKSFYDWKKICGAMWDLDNIEWETADGNLYKGSWKGPWGNGVVYCRLQENINESEN